MTDRLERLAAAGPYVLRTFRTVCSGFAAAPEDVASTRRSHPLPRARATFFRWLRDDAGWSASAIARLWGCDHSSVLRLLETHANAPQTRVDRFREKRRRNDRAHQAKAQQLRTSDMRYVLGRIATAGHAPEDIRRLAARALEAL